MAAKAVTFEKKDNIGIITLARGDRGNVITAETAAALAEIRNQVDFDSDIVALLIAGDGHGAFCTGTDTEAITGYGDRNALLAGLGTASIIGTFDRPTVAAINGDAFDQGLELALACDIRIASDAARFAMTQVGRGTIPWDGGTQRLSRLVGRGKALEMILVGESIDAAEAQRIGLVSRVVPPGDLMPTVLEVVQELASKGPIALRYAKEAIYGGMDMSLDQGLRLEADLYFLLHTTEDRTEGVTAFRDKRDPKFRGT